MSKLDDISVKLKNSGQLNVEQLIALMNEATEVFFDARTQMITEFEEISARQKAQDNVLKEHQELTLAANYFRIYLGLSKTLNNKAAHALARVDMLKFSLGSTDRRLRSIPERCIRVESVEDAKKEYLDVMRHQQRLEEQLKLIPTSLKQAYDNRSDELRTLICSIECQMFGVFELFLIGLHKRFECVQSRHRRSFDLTSAQFLEIFKHYRLAKTHRYCTFNAPIIILNVATHYARVHPDDIVSPFLVLENTAGIIMSHPSLEYIHQAHSLLFLIKDFLNKHGAYNFTNMDGVSEVLTLRQLRVIEQHFDRESLKIRPANPFMLLSSDIADSTQTFFSDLLDLYSAIETQAQRCPEEFMAVFQAMADDLKFFPGAYPHQKSVFLHEVCQVLQDIAVLRKIESDIHIKSYVANFATLVTRELSKESFTLINCDVFARIAKELKNSVISRELLSVLKKAKLTPKIMQDTRMQSAPHSKVPELVTYPNQSAALLETQINEGVIDDDTNWILVKYHRNPVKKEPVPVIHKKRSLVFFGRKSLESTSKKMGKLEEMSSLMASLDLGLGESKSISLPIDIPSPTSAVASAEIDFVSSLELDLTPKLCFDLPPMIQQWFQRLNPQLSFLVGSSVLNLLEFSALQPHQDIDFVSSTHPWYAFGMLVCHSWMQGVLYINQDDRDFRAECFVPHAVNEDNFFEQDLELRDFTICSLYCNHLGEVFDPTGLGLNDHKSKLLRFHKAAFARTYEESVQLSIKSLINDPIQIMRTIKYLERGYMLSPELAEALNKVTIEESQINKPHLYSVTRKILQHYNPESVVQKLNSYGLLHKLFQLEATSCDDLARLNALLFSTRRDHDEPQSFSFRP